LTFGSEEEKPTVPEVPTKYPNHVSYPNYQYEYVQIQLNDTANVTSECWVLYPSGYSRNVTFTDDDQVYIYGNETGLYNYSYYINASSTRFNGTFIVVKNYANETFEQFREWDWDIVINFVFYIIFILLMVLLFEKTKDKIYGVLGGLLIIFFGLSYDFETLIVFILGTYIVLFAMIKWVLSNKRLSGE